MAFTIDQIVGGRPWDLTQAFGQTSWSMGAGRWMYAYCTAYGLLEGSHPGLDIGIPIETRLYCPVNGVVDIAGNTPYFNDDRAPHGIPRAGQLNIRDDDGDVEVFGHMQYIEVVVGQRVAPGTYLGLSGTANGPHLHLECRQHGYATKTGYRAINPFDWFPAAGVDTTPAHATGTNMRFFRVTDHDTGVYRAADTTQPTGVVYVLGDVVAVCDVVLGEDAKGTNERAWGRVAGGQAADQYIYLGETVEVYPGTDGLRFFAVDADILFVRSTNTRENIQVGELYRGNIVPVNEVTQGEEVERGERAWGRIAHGHFADRWIYLGYTSEIK